MKRILSLTTSVLLLTSCASINSVSLTSIPAKKGKPVESHATRMIFLGFNFDNDYVNSIKNDLAAQCPNGEIRGILTKDETFNYFLVFKKHISVSGYCSLDRKTASENESPNAN